MAAPTTLSRPKPIGFTAASGYAVGTAFEAFNATTGETIRKDSTGKLLTIGSTRNGSFDMSWFSSWSSGDKLIVMFAGGAYGSGNLTLTNDTNSSQKIATAITATTTALPGVNL